MPTDKPQDDEQPEQPERVCPQCGTPLADNLHMDDDDIERCMTCDTPVEEV